MKISTHPDSSAFEDRSCWKLIGWTLALAVVVGIVAGWLGRRADAAQSVASAPPQTVNIPPSVHGELVTVFAPQSPTPFSQVTLTFLPTLTARLGFESTGARGDIGGAFYSLAPGFALTAGRTRLIHGNYPAPYQLAPQVWGPHDGAIDFGGTSGTTVDFTAAGPQWSMSFSGPEAAPFLGTGQVALTFRAGLPVAMSSDIGNWAGSTDQRLGGPLTIEYVQ